MALGTTLSKSLSSLTAARHGCRIVLTCTCKEQLLKDCVWKFCLHKLQYITLSVSDESRYHFLDSHWLRTKACLQRRF